MALELVTAPTTEPVTLDEAKTHLRLDGADEDILVSSLIKVAREWCERWQNRAYLSQTWRLHLDAWPEGGWIRVPRPPLASVTSVVYTDSIGTPRTWDTSNYLVDAAQTPGRVALAYGKSWPVETLQPIGAIEVQFIAGVATAAAVDESVKQAMKLLIGHLYENREALGTVAGMRFEVPFGVKALLGQGRIWPL